MDALILRTIGAKEVRAGLRNRWFLLYTALFLVLSIAFATLAIAGSTLTGQPGFGRTSAGLMNLMLLIVPLIGLTIGAQAIVAEREDRFLEFQLAQPVSPGEIFVGKYLGAAASLVLMLAFGLGVSGVILARVGRPAAHEQATGAFAAALDARFQLQGFQNVDFPKQSWQQLGLPNAHALDAHLGGFELVFQGHGALHNYFA